MSVDHAISSKRYYVLGLGKSGQSTVRFLQSKGVSFSVWDDSKETRDSFAEPSLLEDFKTIQNWKSIDCVVVSPGVDLNQHGIMPYLSEHAHVKIINDIELFYWFLIECKIRHHLRIISVTGTNGKSTTVSLIHSVLLSMGRESWLLGNIGIPILDYAEVVLRAVQKGVAEDSNYCGYLVLELSSFQIEHLGQFITDTVVWTNLEPDHLNRYDQSVDKYFSAKRRLLLKTHPRSYVVLGLDDSYSVNLYHQTKKRLVHTEGVSSQSTDFDYFLDKGILYASSHHELSAVLSVAKSTLLMGQHNYMNISFAYLTLLTLDFPKESIVKGIQEFEGLAHRMESFLQFRQIQFINDSKATNANSTISALKALPDDKNIYWILGGIPKTQEGIESVSDWFYKITKAYLIGTAQDMFAKTLYAHGKDYHLSGTLNKAILESIHDALQSKKESIIILSPACASFDQFKNFEHRGDEFKDFCLNVVNKFIMIN